MLQTILERLVDEGKEVLLISHSHREVRADQAVRGLEKSQQLKHGRPGSYESSSWLLLSSKVNQHGRSPNLNYHLHGPDEG